MESTLARAIRLANHPVAILQCDTAPPGAIQFHPNRRLCLASVLLATAEKGRTAALTGATTACPGGKAGLGFVPLTPGTIEYFLSTGMENGPPGEHYKETPALARRYVETMPRIQTRDYVIFQPLETLSQTAQPAAVVFLVNADQLSALATLANYDRPHGDGVQLTFGAGCAQTVLAPLANHQAGLDVCTIGLTDPSARQHIPASLLAFTMPYQRFLTLEQKVAGSFLTQAPWTDLCQRSAPQPT